VHEKPTVKLHLSAIRALFDWLVVKQAIEMNPAHAVRGPKLVVAKGKTPPLTADDGRTLLASIETNTRVDGGAGVTNKTLLRGSQLFLKSQRLSERSLEW
jgi:site-specific recombinase XerC